MFRRQAEPGQPVRLVFQLLDHVDRPPEPGAVAGEQVVQPAGRLADADVGAESRHPFQRQPRLARLLDPNPTLMTPLRVMAIVFAAPTTILLDAFDDLIDRPLLGLPVLGAALVWSFFQGVFILTQVFGLT